MAKAKALTDAPGAGHNSEFIPVDRDSTKYNWLKNQINEAEAAAEEKKVAHDNAKKLVTKARKLFESHGGSLAEFDLARELASMENPDMARARLNRLVSYLHMEGIELTDEILTSVRKDPYENMPDIERDRSVWFERGRVAALSGKGAFAGTPPEGCPPDMTTEWANGVNQGQEEIASSLKKAGPLFDSAGSDETKDGED